MKQKKIKKGRLQRIITLFLWKGFKKIEVRENIYAANRWAECHKKQTAVITIGILSSLMIAALIFPSKQEKENTQKDIMANIVDVQPMFQGLQHIQNFKNFQNHSLDDLTKKGMALKVELDSLIHLSNKTKEDSLLIFKKHKQLEAIVETLKNN